jgi:hypothetical protein
MNPRTSATFPNTWKGIETRYVAGVCGVALAAVLAVGGVALMAESRSGSVPRVQPQSGTENEFAAQTLPYEGERQVQIDQAIYEGVLSSEAATFGTAADDELATSALISASNSAPRRSWQSSRRSSPAPQQVRPLTTALCWNRGVATSS